MIKCPNDEEFFRKEYIKLNKSTTQIAKENNFSTMTVWRRLKKFKINRSISEANLGEKNGMWKGNNVGKSELHNWIRRHKQKPKFCEDCKRRPPFDLANISQEYRRDINDFEWLCRNCHMRKDGRLNKLKRGLRSVY